VDNNISRVMGGLGFFVAVVFLATALTPISNYASAHFAPRPIIRPSGAIVVLGGGVWRGGMLDDDSLRRTIHGIELYKANLAPVIVFSGPPRGENDPSQSEAELRTQLALTMGVPHDAIVKDDAAHTTREESIRISGFLQAHGIHSILLVTESLHMRRAVYLFERAGMEVYPAPADNFSVAADAPGGRLQLATRIAEETAALIYYRLAGYI
jgi:uncharacterized SAM-binding protein YcdF (DUF218 family)